MPEHGVHAVALIKEHHLEPLCLQVILYSQQIDTVSGVEYRSPLLLTRLLRAHGGRCDVILWGALRAVLVSRAWQHRRGAQALL